MPKSGCLPGWFSPIVFIPLTLSSLVMRGSSGRFLGSELRYMLGLFRAGSPGTPSPQRMLQLPARGENRPKRPALAWRRHIRRDWVPPTQEKQVGSRLFREVLS